jgi:predicted nucleotidyltransferase
MHEGMGTSFLVPNKGTIEPNFGTPTERAQFFKVTADSLPIAHALFGKAQRGVLALLFGHPERALYVREIVAAAGTGASQVQKELELLTRAGLLLRERRANQVYFRANPDAPIFPELKGIIAKTFGIADIVREALAPLETKITAALIFGSVARGEHHAASDVDVLVVGNVLLSDLAVGLEAAEQRLNRHVSVTLMDRREFARRQRGKEHFVTAVMKGAKIWLIGNAGSLLQKSR